MDIDKFIDNYDKVSDNSGNLLSGIFNIGSRLPANSKTFKIISALGVINATTTLARSAYEFWDENIRKDPFEYQIEISGELASFNILHEIFSNNPDVIESTKNSHLLTAAERYIPEDAKRNFSTENSGIITSEMDIFGVHCEVIYVPKRVSVASAEEKVSAMKAGSYVDRFLLGFKTAEDRKVFSDHLSARVSETTKAPPKIYKSVSGMLDFREDLRKRSLDSVFLKEGQMERLVQGIETFQNNSDVYDKLELPYHMGILLYGPPGTGKSTTISALASRFSMDIVWVNLSTVPGDEALEDILDDAPEDCLIVFEDVDCVSATQDRSVDRPSADLSGRVTSSGLLNVLGGHLTPLGSIFVLTTNHKEKLDPALIRPGRVDYSEEIDHMDSYQFDKFFEFVFDKPAEGFPEILPKHGISPATIMGEVKKDISDLDLAESRVREFIGRIVND